VSVPVQLEVPSEGHPLVAEVWAAQEEVLWRLRGWRGHPQCWDGYLSDGQHARQSRKYPCPVRRPSMAEEIFRSRVVYAASSRHR
jgi:hypothetical protein